MRNTMQTSRRNPPRLAAALLAAGLTVGPAAPALAVGEVDVVGGPRLAAKGLVVDPAAPAPPQVAAASWIVADLDTGEVLAAKDPHGRYAPASALKTLTAVALIPELERDRKVAATFDDVNIEGSKVGIKERVGYPVHELFTALLMVSGNDAANVLASAAGGQARTAALMNAKAAELKALDTHAVNPHGLDAPGQVTSAYDLALIARAGLADPQFTAYAATRQSSISGPGRQRVAMANKNKLFASYPGTLGGKNGFTSAARASYVGGAERDGRRLVVALLKSAPRVFDEAAKLLDWGFAARGVEPVGTLVSVKASRKDPKKDVTAAAATRSRGTDIKDAPQTDAQASTRSTSGDESTGLPVTLAGMGLAAAALMMARPGRRPARRTTGRPSPRRPLPVRR